MFAKPLCAADPFDLLLAPDAVFQAVARSEHLGQLRRRICRPLDVKGEGDGDASAPAARDRGFARDFATAGGRAAPVA